MIEKSEEIIEQDTSVETEQEEPKSQETENGVPATTMEALLEQEEINLELPRQGETRMGTIISLSEDEILVSIGAKSEGIIPGKELVQIEPEEREKLGPGDEIPVYVITPEDSQGNLILSYIRAQEEQDWNRAEEMEGKEELYEGIIDGFNKGGLIVKFGNLRGFVPASQVSLSRRMAYGRGDTPEKRWGQMVGEPIITRIIEVDRGRRRLILSELAALQESRDILKERLLEEIEVGQVVTGRVTSLADFGAFVNINGADGLVHLTEISWERIKHPSDVLQVGQEVKVEVISIDEEKKRIGLSIRQLKTDPWPEKAADYQVGQLVEAEIVRLVKFGAFARLENGLEGLVHISELADHRIEHPKEIIKDGEVITLRIIKIDPERRRIGLSLRKVHSTAYADLDLEMALAEEDETVEEDEEESAKAELAGSEEVEEAEEVPLEEAQES